MLAESNRSYDTKPRLIGLDLLRFLATSFVLIDHSRNFGLAGKIFETFHGFLGEFLVIFSSLGPVSVHVFFVLSGFLVSSLLFQEIRRTGTASPGRFLIRRGFKIYPAFWIMLLAAIVWARYSGGIISASQIFGELFYLQNYDWQISFHTWSLAVEEHFYFLLAGIFLFARWRTRPGQAMDLRWIPNLCLTVALICLLARFFVWWFVLNRTVTNNFLFIHADYVVIDSLFFGLLLSFYWHNLWDKPAREKIARFSLPLALLGLGLLLPLWSSLMGSQYYGIFGFVLIYLGAGSLLLSSLALDRRHSSRALCGIAWLGQYSYSVYLWHLLVGFAIFPHLSPHLDYPAGWVLNTLIYYCTAWIVGILLARIIEFPIIRLRDRWFPSPNRPVTPTV